MCLIFFGGELKDKLGMAQWDIERMYIEILKIILGMAQWDNTSGRVRQVIVVKVV